MFRKTPVNLRTLKALAARLGATVMRPYYPVSDLFRVIRDDDGLQLDFMATIHGVPTFAGLRARAQSIEIGGAPTAGRVAGRHHQEQEIGGAPTRPGCPGVIGEDP